MTRLTPWRYWRLLALVCTLLGVQQMALTHAYTHDHHRADAHASSSAPDDTDTDAAESCVECLALHGLQAAPPPTIANFRKQASGDATVATAVPPAPSFAYHLAYYGRAPPPLQG